jgi:ankyrin repeat protein
MIDYFQMPPLSQGLPLPELHQAVKEGRLSDVQKLLEHGKNVNEVDLEGQTPLHTASKYGQDRIADLLLNHGANMEAKDKWVSLALFLFAFERR